MRIQTQNMSRFTTSTSMSSPSSSSPPYSLEYRECCIRTMPSNDTETISVVDDTASQTLQKLDASEQHSPSFYQVRMMQLYDLSDGIEAGVTLGMNLIATFLYEAFAMPIQNQIIQPMMTLKSSATATTALDEDNCHSSNDNHCINRSLQQDPLPTSMIPTNGLVESSSATTNTKQPMTISKQDSSRTTSAAAKKAIKVAAVGYGRTGTVRTYPTYTNA